MYVNLLSVSHHFSVYLSLVLDDAIELMLEQDWRNSTLKLMNIKQTSEIG